MRKSDRKVNFADCRKLLLARRSELLPRRPIKLDMSAQAGHLPVEDQVMLLHDEFVSIKLSNLERETLKRIDAALERLDSGEYGSCIECGGTISARRLEAIPWASRCVQCEDHLGAGPDSTERTGKAA